MELFARKLLILRVLKFSFNTSTFGLHFSTPLRGNSGDDNSKENPQNELNNIHTYESIENPDSLVKTTVIKRRSILQHPKTAEQILEDAEKNVAKRPLEEFKSGRSHVPSKAEGNYIKKYWGHDERKGYLGYDLFQELEERLEEILSIHGKDTLEKQEDNHCQNDTKQEINIDQNGKVRELLESLSRLICFYLFRSSLYQKHW